MALPYLAACLWPGLARALPRPGAWMARFKTAMAFPMFATVVWLVWVLGQQVGIDGAAALLALLVALAFALWVFAASARRRRRGGIARAAGGGVGAGGRRRVVAGRCSRAMAPHRPAARPRRRPGAWQPWSPERVRPRACRRPAGVRRLHRRVVRDLPDEQAHDAERRRRAATRFARARWCLMRADWTRRDPAITDALRALGRSGVPVYALYAPSASAAAVVVRDPHGVRGAGRHRALARTGRVARHRCGAAAASLTLDRPWSISMKKAWILGTALAVGCVDRARCSGAGGDRPARAGVQRRRRQRQDGVAGRLQGQARGARVGEPRLPVRAEALQQRQHAGHAEGRDRQGRDLARRQFDRQGRRRLPARRRTWSAGSRARAAPRARR